MSLKNRLKAQVNSSHVSAHISFSHKLPWRWTKNIFATKVQKNRKFTTARIWMHLYSVFNITFNDINFRFPLQKNESFFQYEQTPINCVLASTVVFSYKHRCKWLCLYLFDCCRACNAKYAKCYNLLRFWKGGPAFCYRKSYLCMCTCLGKHQPPENYKSFPPIAIKG